MQIRRIVLALAVVVGAAGGPWLEPARGDSGHYPPAQLSLRDSFLAPRGLYFSASANYLRSRNLFDAAGGSIDTVSLDLPDFPGALPFDLDVEFDSANLWAGVTWVALDLEEIGLRYAARFTPRVSQGSLDAAVLLSPVIDEVELSLLDTELSPLVLSYTRGHVQAAFAYSIWIPLGDYSADLLVNPGRGFWTQQLQAALGVYYSAERYGGAILRATWETHQEEDQRPYLPGDALTLEYGWSQTLGEYRDVSFVLTGYGYSQLQITRSEVDVGYVTRNTTPSTANDLIPSIERRLPELHGAGGEFRVSYREQLNLNFLAAYDYAAEGRLTGLRLGFYLTFQFGGLKRKAPQRR